MFEQSLSAQTYIKGWANSHPQFTLKYLEEIV